MSGRDSVTRAAPGWSMTRSASIPDFPDRGRDKMRVWSSARAKTRRKYWARPSRTAYSVVRAARRWCSRIDGRARRPWCSAASRDQRTASSARVANPGPGRSRNMIRHRIRRTRCEENSVTRADTATTRTIASTIRKRMVMTGSRRGCRRLCRGRRFASVITVPPRRGRRAPACGRRGRLSRTRTRLYPVRVISSS